MKKRTSSKTLLKPTKYQHFHFSSRSRGPPQTTKITPGAPLDPPQTPSENFTCFRSLPGASPGTPRGFPGTPRDRPRPPRDAQGPPGEPPTPPRDPPSDPQGPPEDAQDPPRESHRAKGPPRDRPLDSARRNARSD